MQSSASGCRTGRSARSRSAGPIGRPRGDPSRPGSSVEQLERQQVDEVPGQLDARRAGAAGVRRRGAGGRRRRRAGGGVRATVICSPGGVGVVERGGRPTRTPTPSSGRRRVEARRPVTVEHGGGVVASAGTCPRRAATPPRCARRARRGDSASPSRPSRAARATRRPISRPALPTSAARVAVDLVGIAAELDGGEVGDADARQRGDALDDLVGRADDGDVGRRRPRPRGRASPGSSAAGRRRRRPWRRARGRRRRRSVTQTGRAAITRGAGRPAASAAALIVGMVCVGQRLRPGAPRAACRRPARRSPSASAGRARRRRSGTATSPATETPAWTRKSSPSNDDGLAPRQRAEHGQVLAQVADRLGEAHAHHRLDHDLVAQADAEAQPAAAGRVRRQGLLGQHHRVPRVRRHDARAELDARHLAADDGERRERVVAEDLRRPVRSRSPRPRPAGPRRRRRRSSRR